MSERSNRGRQLGETEEDCMRTLEQRFEELDAMLAARERGDDDEGGELIGVN